MWVRTSQIATEAPIRAVRRLRSSYAADRTTIHSDPGVATDSDRNPVSGEGLTAASEAISWTHAGRGGVIAESSHNLPSSDSRLSTYLRNAMGFAVDHNRT